MSQIKDIDKKRFIISGLRRLTGRWPPRSAARNKAKISIQEGFYKNGKPKWVVVFMCASCTGLFSRTDTQMDHIHPVVDLEGFSGWDDYFNNMFCDEDGWQVLCKGCHKIKTKIENAERKKNKKKA